MNNSTYLFSPYQEFESFQAGKKANSSRTDFFLLSVLLCSFFYVLPLGRFSLAGTTSDFRIYDFAYFFVALLVGGKHIQHVISTKSSTFPLVRKTIILIVLVLFSLIFTFMYTGGSNIFTVIIRTYRFIMYFSIPLFIIGVVTTPRRQKLLFNLLYLNILVQCYLAFAQGLGYIPDLWPSYWRIGYYQIVPVGTLSPHHLQIAIIMMLGMVMSITNFRAHCFIPYKLFFAANLAMMVVVIVMSGTRTAWFSLPPMIIAYIFQNRLRGIGIVFAVGLVASLLFLVVWDYVHLPLVEQINVRIIDPIQYNGVEEIFDDRVEIYSGDFINRLSNRPWVLIGGTGFQNIIYLLGTTGAHNNYLQAWFELGVVGLIVYLSYLKSILKTLTVAAKKATRGFEEVVARDTWVVFIGVLVSMLAGETLWAQYSQFTLSGQILALVGIACASINWSGKLVSDNHQQR